MSKRGPLYNPAKKRAIGLSEHLPVLSTQETFRLEHFADHVSPVRSPMPGQHREYTSGDLQSQILVQRKSNTTTATRAESVSPVSASPVPATSGAVFDRTVAEVTKFIDSEIALLGTCDDGAATQPGLQRLTIFKEAFRMLLPLLVPTVSRSLQRIMREYDKFLVDMERQTATATQKRERERLEQHYQKHFMEEALVKETLLMQREAEFAARESEMTLKLKQLENQLLNIREENRVLRQQQNDDTEKYMTMAQAVVESRLTAQKGDLAMMELREFQAKRDMLEKNQKLLLEDANAMYSLLKKNKIPFTSSGKFIYVCD